jgi:putative lipoic acid-binding regulatory protein
MPALDDQWIKAFSEKLDSFYAWPSLYTFKFIVPSGREDEVKNLFPNHTTTTKASDKGKYTSVTFQMMMPSAEAVIEVYKRAATVTGIIAL